MTDTTATPPTDPAGPWAIPVRRPLPGDDKPGGSTSFPRKVWHLLVAIKDGLALIFLLLFFVALFALLAGRPNASLPVSKGALVVDFDGVVTEQPSDVDPLAALSGGGQLKELRTRDIVHALETAATDKRVTSVVLDLDRFLGGGQVSLAEIGAAVDKVRAAKKPVLAFATAYTTDSYQVAAHASEIWSDAIGGVAIAGPGGSRLYYKGLMDKLGITAHIYRVGTFKSAVEPYLRSDQSPEAKEADRAYAGVLWENWLTDVRKARPKAKIDGFIADTAGAVKAAGNDLSKAGVEAGLIDKVGSRMAFSERVAEISGVYDDSRPWEYNAIPLENWVAANPPEEKGAAIAVRSLPSGPFRIRSTSAQSAIERHRGPILSMVHESAMAPVFGTRPNVGRTPATPQRVLGETIEPRVSVPMENPTSPAAVAEAEPAEDPLELRL